MPQRRNPAYIGLAFLASEEPNVSGKCHYGGIPPTLDSLSGLSTSPLWEEVICARKTGPKVSGVEELLTSRIPEIRLHPEVSDKEEISHFTLTREKV